MEFEPTLYDIVRYLDRRLRLAHSFEAQGFTDGMVKEIPALDTAIGALYPFVESEINHDN